MNPEKVLLSKVESFIKEKGMLDKERPVLVGLSGGADSTALTDTLVTLGYKCIAAHCNFHLRGEESQRDHEFARLQARTYNLPFREVDFRAKEYAAARHISIEMACRELRYAWFEDLMRETGSQAIAVAHHKDDSIETFFLNLIRGTGINGLTGINAINGNVVRPMLNVTRREIEDYLASRNIDFIIDSSNKEDIYKRNKIRLQLMPLVKSINPSATESIMRTIANLQHTEMVYSEAIRLQKDSVITEEGNNKCISIEKLRQQPSPKALLFEILKDYQVPGVMVDDIVSSLDGISGKQFFAGSYRILKDRDFLIISPRDDSSGQDSFIIPQGISFIDKPNSIQFEVKSNYPGFQIPKDKNIACFDADLIEWPLELRRWKQGDTFVPFGMRGVKKVSDFFSDNKFSVFDKEKAWMMVTGERICWIVGERTDNRFRVNSKTKRILIVSLH